MSEIKGDLKVCGILDARRVNQGLLKKTITGTEQLTGRSEWWQALSAASAQDVVLPDATTLPEGWATVVCADGVANLDVKTFHVTTPVSRKIVAAGECYEFTLIDNGTSAGVWNVNFLTENAMSASARFVVNFNATTDWGAAVGGVYTMTILQSAHTKGMSPQVDTFELSGVDFLEVGADIKVLANGDIEISVPEVPDCRFAGKAVVI